MGRVSTKKNKSLFQIRREELKYSREKASEEIKFLSDDQIEKIENGKITPKPEDVIAMAKAYRQPSLCNYYCSTQCAIGKRYVPEVKVKDISSIVLEVLASLNSMHKQQEKLIEIASDGMISQNEIKDFVSIQKKLEDISVAVEALQLWSEQMIADKKIDIDLYNELSK
ncbi:MAG: helix-turn-helix transcriptional regulator [Clostridia bacterium]|nr:helix-turn-helix transcriptional regulator [Clostridia bacterium]